MRFLLFTALLAAAAAAAAANGQTLEEALPSYEPQRHLKNASHETFNFLVTFKNLNDNPVLQTCYGSIISKDFVLTSTMCIDLTEGKKNISTKIVTRLNSRIHEILNVMKHPEMDLAVVQVKPSFNFSTHLQPIQMYGYEERYKYENKMVKAIVDSPASEHVSFIEAPLVNQSECTDGYICLLRKYSGFPTTGAPIILDGRIVALTLDGALQNYQVTKYTEIGPLRNWIEQHMAGLTVLGTEFPLKTEEKDDSGFLVGFERKSHPYSCLGSIISENFVMTSANCLRSFKFDVVAGNRVHQMADVIKHPNMDLALVRVEPSFEFDDSTHSVEMYKAGDEYDFKNQVARVTQIFHDNIMHTSKLYNRNTRCSGNYVCFKIMEFFRGGAPVTLGGRLFAVVPMTGRSIDEEKSFVEIAPFQNWVEEHTKKYHKSQRSPMDSRQMYTFNVSISAPMSDLKYQF